MKTMLLLMLLAVSALYAATCDPGYEETAAIQVIDGRVRPIANATVQILFQVDNSTGQGYTTTAPKMTDSDGIVSITFRNREFSADRVDCTYTIITSYDGQKKMADVTVGEHGAIISDQLDVYYLNVHAVDQNSLPLADADLSSRGIRAKTDSDGRATLIVANGTLNVTLKYGEGSVVRQIYVQNDTDYYYQVPIYNVSIYVVDDANMPLMVNASIGGKTVYTDSKGFASVQKLLTAKPAIKTYYRGVEKTVDADLAVQSTYYSVYDLHAPKITNLVARDDSGRVVLDMVVYDEGLRASGLAPDGIKAKYDFGGVEYFAPVYVTAKDEYQAAIGSIGKDGIVEISIDAKDNEGNIRSVRGYFSITHSNETVINDGGGTEQTDTFGIGPVQIIGAGLVLIVLLVVAGILRQKIESAD